MELKRTFLLIEHILESEEKAIPKNGQSGPSSAFPVKTLCVCILKDLRGLHAGPPGGEHGKRLREEWQDIPHLLTLQSVLIALRSWCLGFVSRNREIENTLVIL